MLPSRLMLGLSPCTPHAQSTGVAAGLNLLQDQKAAHHQVCPCTQKCVTSWMGLGASFYPWEQGKAVYRKNWRQEMTRVCVIRCEQCMWLRKKSFAALVALGEERHIVSSGTVGDQGLAVVANMVTRPYYCLPVRGSLPLLLKSLPPFQATALISFVHTCITDGQLPANLVSCRMATTMHLITSEALFQHRWVSCLLGLAL
jgi:hypothetical protein